MSSVGEENIPPLAETTRDRKYANLDEGKKKSVAGKKTVSIGSSGRKMLQTLQPSGKNKKLLVGSDGLVRLGSGGKTEIKIYKDPEGPRTSTPERKEHPLANKIVQASVMCTTAETQVEDRDTAQYRAEQIMYGAVEDLPIEYWKDLAEKRREALENSLHENEELHTSLSFLEEENEKLTVEKDTFKSLAERAEELVKILNSIVSSDDEDDENGADQDQPQPDSESDRSYYSGQEPE